MCVLCIYDIIRSLVCQCVPYFLDNLTYKVKVYLQSASSLDSFLGLPPTLRRGLVYTVCACTQYPQLRGFVK